MADLPSTPSRIQIEETRFRSPISESMIQKLGSTQNYILDHYVLPPGAIFDYAGTEDTIPSGWFPCDGRALSRTTYAALFASLSTYWGVGDGLTTFNIPDLRGLFTRMVDVSDAGDAGRDADGAIRAPIGTGTGENIGSYQADAFRSHDHKIGPQGGSNGGAAWSEGTINGPGVDVYVDGAGGSETRPKNAYVFKIIKT